MPIEDFIISVCCCVDENWHILTDGKRLRQRGYGPKLTDQEVITMKVERLIFVDETGINLSLTRLYARALIGKRAEAHKPFKSRSLSECSGYLVNRGGHERPDCGRGARWRCVLRFSGTDRGSDLARG